MGLFEDFSRFLETRLEEFLRDHPDLELQPLRTIASTGRGHLPINC
ncbi:hypothetical protein AmaxDRAFT_4297 [Limnospira maxima CS-328]|uniref:Uncharacterized protein n=1 Tax=Limnospira maxima CS-328 TaxID=513049 RepID=B5W698_LIMMA|nr:hypothetical protein AmaxDRAFT_4297 [Limnospira maxima CS-328]